MIKLCESSIPILSADGSSSVFDPDELQSRLIRACIAAGVRDAWLAEDISLAIEYSLTQRRDADDALSMAEIDATVMKTLEDAGYPEVAEAFRDSRPSKLPLVPSDAANAASLASKHLGLSGNQLAATSAQVAAACLVLGIHRAAPALLLELARHFRRQEAPVPASLGLPELSPQAKASNPWLLSSEEILASAPDDLRLLSSKGVLRVYGVSRLFPALKFDLKLVAFAESLGLESPLTEMAVLPHFHRLALALNNLSGLVMRSCSRLGQSSPPPLSLCVPDMSRFARECLGAEWPEAEPSCRALLSTLLEQLSPAPFKISLK
ncbi:MAG: hypothetical protein A2X49_00125 [Lentisphaerae bacterium GWF2_52_8]|nr:MAG: hypothetical protein A2X49_00125 [Lentisphaerae bacterium GWF2_52_8]